MAISTNLYVIAAICGNFYQESTVNPGIWENLTINAPGYGLGQWTDNPPIVERRTALFNWLTANGYSHDSGEGQLKFLVYENVWIPSTFTPSAYNTLTDYFNSTSTNLSDLVYEFMWHWEGIDDGSFSTRYSYAQDVYNLFIHDNGQRDPWYTGNRYLARDSESMANSLLIKDFFLEEEPPEPPEPPTPEEPTIEQLIAMVQSLKKKKKIGGITIYV